MWTSDDEYFSPIEQAIVLGDIEGFRVALDAGIESDTLNQAVIDAAAYGNVEMLRLLHARDADLRVRNGAALSVAAGNGHEAACAFMIDRSMQEGRAFSVDDINVALRQTVDALCPDQKNARLRHTRAPTDAAAHIRIVERLIEAGATAHQKDGNIMGRACHRGPLELVDLLLRSGVDLEREGTVFLRFADWRGNPAILERLFEAGLNPHETPDLSLACSLFDARTLREGLEAPPAVAVKSAFRRSPL